MCCILVLKKNNTLSGNNMGEEREKEGVKGDEQKKEKDGKEVCVWEEEKSRH